MSVLVFIIELIAKVYHLLAFKTYNRGTGKQYDFLYF